MNMLQKIKFAIFAGSILLISSCKKDVIVPSSPATETTQVYIATLRGSNEVPSNSSTATGNAILVFDKATKKFTITVNYTGLTATAAHIHRALAGTNGPVMFGFVSSIISPIYYPSAVLTATQEADLTSNLYYVNVHSATAPGGEIRGQLLRQ